jgi:prophage DNA circulation protein
VMHEYPKRNKPYAEDMGRHAIRFHLAGYLIYRPTNPVYEYTSQRTRLYEALEKDEADTLIHPVFAPGGLMVMCERYTMTENRERGGYTQFDMQFVEAGAPVSSTGVSLNTVSNVLSKALAVENFWLSFKVEIR